jgi:hypothetical protein
MKRRNIRLTMLVMCVGAAAITMTGCYHAMILNKYGKMVLYPQNGNILEWNVPVTFQGASPCKEGKTTSKCTLNVKVAAGQEYAHYRYGCKQCTDPEVDVGPSTGSKHKLPPPPTQQGTLAKAPDQFIEIPCLDGITPDPSTATLKPGQLIEWEANGGTGQFLAKWTITPDPGLCQNASISESQPQCQILATTPPASYNYTVKDTAGVCKDGKGVITITP